MKIRLRRCLIKEGFKRGQVTPAEADGEGYTETWKHGDDVVALVWQAARVSVSQGAEINREIKRGDEESRA